MQRRHGWLVGAAIAAAVFCAPAQAATTTTVSNPAAITFPSPSGAGAHDAFGQGSLYPSPIAVAGTVGKIVDVNVKLNQLTHTNPDDLGFEVSAPAGSGGQDIDVLDGAGGTIDVSNVNLTLDDQAGGSVPDSGPITGGTFRPSVYAVLPGPTNPFGDPPPGGSGFCIPGPTSSKNCDLASAFNGNNANGTWNLRAFDFFEGAGANSEGDDSTGSLSGGWGLEITTDLAPSALGDSKTTNEDTAASVAAPGVLANDTDLDDGSIHAVLVSGPSHAASFTLNSDGSYNYTPAANYHGPDSFTYKAADAYLQSNTATVSLTVFSVNDAPTAADGTGSTDEDTTLDVAAPGALTGAADVDGDPVTAQLVSGPAHAANFTLNSDGSYHYEPAPEYHGPDSFTYKANDGALDSATKTINLTVNSVNDAPSAADGTGSTDEDTPLEVAAPGVLTGASDIDGDPLTAQLVSGPAHGILTLNPNGSYRYEPAANYKGPDSFKYKANDGSLNSAAKTIDLTVKSVNDKPTVADSSRTLEAGSQLVSPAPGVLDDASDVEGDPLTAAVATAPAHGSVAVNPDGSFTYTPAAGYAGPDSFTFVANDGTADSAAGTVSLTITAPQPLRLGISHRGVLVRGRAIRLELRCRATSGRRCAGTLRLASAAGTSRLLRAAATYGTARFDVAAGTDGAVTIKAPASLRRKLAKRHKVIARVTVNLTQDVGAASTIERRITLIG
jgi:VCBS repeat-containing protein